VTTLRVRSAGLVTLQDAGRDGYQSDGVPLAGALDAHSYRQACLLMSGSDASSSPAFEILGGRLDVVADAAVEVAVTGAGWLGIEGRAASADTVHHLPPGSSALVEHAGPGPAYLAVCGLRAPMILGSCATDTFSGLGPPVVRMGDEFAVHAGQSRAGLFLRPRPRVARREFRVIGHLGTEGRPPDEVDPSPFFRQGWTVQLTARSGVRMRVAELEQRTPAPELPQAMSGPTLAGAIQLAPSGEAIILGPDGAVTGGYPTIGAIISADLGDVARLSPGDRITLRPVSVRWAAAQWAAQQDSLVTSLVDPSLI
jgi:allophanate hydrolase subunit 2